MESTHFWYHVYNSEFVFSRWSVTVNATYNRKMSNTNILLISRSTLQTSFWYHFLFHQLLLSYTWKVSKWCRLSLSKTNLHASYNHHPSQKMSVENSSIPWPFLCQCKLILNKNYTMSKIVFQNGYNSQLVQGYINRRLNLHPTGDKNKFYSLVAFVLT